MSADHYATLGVPKEATDAQIKKAFRRKASKAHPDRGGDGEEMAELNAAWACLSDPIRRKQYDETGVDTEAPSVENAGEAMLRGVFDGVLTQSIDTVNIVARVRAILLDEASKMLQQSSQIAQATRALNKARNRVKKKSREGVNLYHQLIDSKLRTLAAGRLETDQRMAALKEALRLLDDYEDELQAPPDLASFTTGRVFLKDRSG